MSNPIAVFETSAGTFRAEIFLEQMPVTAGNFLELVRNGFYDGLHFHRVIDGFMVQFGCPNSRDPHDPSAGTGDSPLGSIADEHNKKFKKSNTVGTLSMANAGPNTGSSQFFINTAHNKQLDWWRWFGRVGQHPVFGEVIEGMDVVNRIECCPTDDFDNPREPVQVTRVFVDE